MAKVYVNGRAVDIGNDRLNLIQAADRAGVFVPHYCWHPSLTVVASCRMCLVEVGEMKDGQAVMQPKVVPGCQTPAKEGTVIVTNSAKAKAAQAQTLEGILLNHPLDCPVCDKAGECLLQDYSYRYGYAVSRMIDDKRMPPNKPELSSKITLFTDRCIMCTRCVRFTREISGEGELTVINRGDHSEIDIFPGVPLENKLAGNVVDLCPVGALGSKDFLYKQRVWYLNETPSVCPNCSTGCSVTLDTNKSVLFRLRPRENHQSQGWFMCDEGRLGYHYVNEKERIKRPHMNEDGKQSVTTWANVLPELRQRFADAAHANTNSVAAVFSPFLTCEEAFLLAKYVKGLSKEARLYLGPVPIVGDDDTYPKDRRGRPIVPVKFTIRSEKCPNRRGVSEILQHFQGEVLDFNQALESAQRGEIKALWVAASYPQGGGYVGPNPWISDAQAKALRKSSFLVVQDLLPTSLSATANIVLPSAAWAEKDGTFVNYAGLAQAIRKAAHAPGESRSEGQVYSDLMGRRGLLQVSSVRRELAAVIPKLAGLAELPALGARLELTMAN